MVPGTYILRGAEQDTFPGPELSGFQAAYNPNSGNWGVGIGAATPTGWFRAGSGEAGAVEVSGWAYNGIWGPHGQVDVEVDWDEVDWKQPQYENKTNVRSDNNITSQVIMSTVTEAIM